MSELDEPDKRWALRAWMDAHDGIVSTAELRALAFTKREIDGMVERHELARTRRGLYRGRGVRADLRAELRGALARHSSEARLVLFSALHWQGLLRWPPPIPEIGLPGRQGVRRLEGRTIHFTPYARCEARMHDGLPCAAPADALPHLAGQILERHAPRRAFRRALREAVRAEPGLVAEFQSLVDSRSFKGVREMRAALLTLPTATVIRSDLEEDFVTFCDVWGLPPFQMNRLVGGLERDAVRVEERLIVELDTRGYHGNLIAMESDRRRRRRATVAGWRHVEITGYDLRDEPGRVAADLAALLELTGWTPPAGASIRWAAVIASARGVWLPTR